MEPDEMETAMAAVLATSEGRILYSYIVGMSGIFAPAPATEPERTAFIGHRAFGLQLVKAFRRADPDACALAEKEYRIRKAAEKAAEKQRISIERERKTRLEENDPIYSVTRNIMP